MAVLRRRPAKREEAPRLTSADYEERERQYRNLAARAKRRGVRPDVQAQREWVKANPVGFEVSE